MILRANLRAKFTLSIDTEKTLILLMNQVQKKLLRYGHMITKFAGKKQFIQPAFISDDYIENIIEKF